MIDIELVKEIVLEIKRENKQPVLRFTLELGETGLLESKVGGIPYLPSNVEWPLDSYGTPLVLLAQINCTDLVELPDFPHTGLLQIFTGDDELFGMETEDYTRMDSFRIFYYQSVDTTVTMEAVLAKAPDFSEVNSPIIGEDGYFYSKQSCRICFTDVTNQEILGDDFRFETLFVQKWNQCYPEMPIEDLRDLRRQLPEDFYFDDILDEEFENVYCHQLGGYPFFAQYDFRKGFKGQYKDLDVLLFQLAEDAVGEEMQIYWGDAGIGNFFINREDLLKLDFSRVAYQWDC